MQDMYKKNASKQKRKQYHNDPIYKEKERLRRLQWFHSHKKQANATLRRWCKENRDKVRARYARYYPALKQNPVFRLKNSQRARVREVLKREDILKKNPTLVLVGCSAIQLKEYLTSKFQFGMTWENHGVHGWHVDHIKPLASFDLSDPNQMKIAFHYTNLQPLWCYENLKKGSKVTDLCIQLAK